MNLKLANAKKIFKSKRATLTFLGIFLLTTLVISNADVSVYAYPDNLNDIDLYIDPYDVTIDAYYLTDNISVQVEVLMDESDLQVTPYTFVNLTDSHNFTVSAVDPNDHPFVYWDDDNTLTSPNRTISFGGNYTAIYSAPIIPTVPIEVEIKINPQTLNLKSRGKFVTIHIELPDGYNFEDINLETVKLEGILAITYQKYGFVTDDGDDDKDEIRKLTVKFDRAAVQKVIKGMIGEGNDKFQKLELIVTGELSDGTSFEGYDTIKVINSLANSSPQSNNDQDNIEDDEDEETKSKRQPRGKKK